MVCASYKGWVVVVVVVVWVKRNGFMKMDRDTEGQCNRKSGR